MAIRNIVTAIAFKTKVISIVASLATNKQTIKLACSFMDQHLFITKETNLLIGKLKINPFVRATVTVKFAITFMIAVILFIRQKLMTTRIILANNFI